MSSSSPVANNPVFATVLSEIARALNDQEEDQDEPVLRNMEPGSEEQAADQEWSRRDPVSVMDPTTLRQEDNGPHKTNFQDSNSTVLLSIVDLYSDVDQESMESPSPPFAFAAETETERPTDPTAQFTANPDSAWKCPSFESMGGYLGSGELHFSSELQPEDSISCCLGEEGEVTAALRENRALSRFMMYQQQQHSRGAPVAADLQSHHPREEERRATTIPPIPPQPQQTASLRPPRPPRSNQLTTQTSHLSPAAPAPSSHPPSSSQLAHQPRSQPHQKKYDDLAIRKERRLLREICKKYLSPAEYHRLESGEQSHLYADSSLLSEPGHSRLWEDKNGDESSTWPHANSLNHPMDSLDSTELLLGNLNLDDDTFREDSLCMGPGEGYSIATRDYLRRHHLL